MNKSALTGYSGVERLIDLAKLSIRTLIHKLNYSNAIAMNFLQPEV